MSVGWRTYLINILGAEYQAFDQREINVEKSDPELLHRLCSEMTSYLPNIPLLLIKQQHADGKQLPWLYFVTPIL